MLKKSLLVLLLLFPFTMLYAEDYLECSVNSGCDFLLHAGSGWHVKLNDIQKNHRYSCVISGLAASKINQEKAHEAGIFDAVKEQIDPMIAKVNFSTFKLISEPNSLYIDVENYSDIPFKVKIYC